VDALYGVGNETLKRAVKRNIGRFPSGFMIQVSNHEVAKGGHGYRHLAFTEQGIAMLSSVLLKTPQQTNAIGFTAKVT
jgi:ORF6N domain-containing protein